MKKPQAMMVYPEAWKASPRIAAMHPAARSGYWEILLSMWLAGGELPDDDGMLMACARLTPKDWKAHRVAIRKMLTVSDGMVTQDRLAEEYGRTIELVQKRKEAAELRWERERLKKQKQKRSKADASAMQVHVQNGDFAYETETETVSTVRSNERTVERAFDPEPGLRRFEAEAKRLAADRWVLQPTEFAWVEVVDSEAKQAEVFEGLEHWKGSRQWADGVFDRWDRWLTNLKFQQRPKTAGPVGVSAAEERRRRSLEAIQQA